MQAQLLSVNAIIAFIKNKLDLILNVDALPEDGGMSIEVMPGSNNWQSLDKQAQQRTIPLLFMSKYKDQITAFDNLLLIGNMLSKTKFFDVHFSDDVQILSADVKTEAALVGKDGDYWIYSMIADIKIYY
jgi:hypothetical protein